MIGLTEAERLDRLFRTFHRRAITVYFLYTLTTFTGVALVVLSLGILLEALPRPTLAVVVAVPGLLIVSALLTLVRRPSRARVARSIDRGARLEELVSTAIDFRKETDPVSQLVVREAARRLSAVRAADVFPFEVPRHASPVAAAVILLVVAIVVGRPGVRQFTSFVGSIAARLSQASTAATTQTQARDANRPVASSPGDHTSTAGSQSSVASTRKDEPTTPRATAQDSAGTRGQFNELQTEPERRNDTSEAARRSDGAAAAVDRLVAASTDPGGAASQGVDGPPASGGGARRGSQTEGTTTPAMNSGATYRIAYQAARATVENPTAQARIPPARRALVRQYFTAIRPQETQ